LSTTNITVIPVVYGKGYTMLPIMKMLGEHNLDFANNNYDDLVYYTISELRKLPFPDDIYLMQHEALVKQFPNSDLSRFTDIEEWCPVSFPGFSGDKKILERSILTIGKLSTSIVFTPEYIILPSTIHERIDWYSPNYKEKVQAWRSFYKTIINHFGGDHALYVDEKVFNKYFPQHHKPLDTALAVLEQTLITKYGASKKSIFDYPHGKFPKYYIDTFKDIE
jgi:hypothetical protein